MNHSIYALVDPITRQIRYIGVTAHSLQRRLKEHLRERKPSHRINWIKSLKAKSLIPLIKLIESVSAEDRDISERFWIAFFRERGDLVNMSDGGEGQLGYRASPATRAKIAANSRGNKYSLGHRWSDERKLQMSLQRKGKQPRLGVKDSDATKHKHRLQMLGNQFAKGFKHSKETRDKVSAALKGRVISADTRAKFSAIHRGKIVSSETRSKMKSAWLTRAPASPETRAKISMAMKDRKFSDDHRLHLSEANQRRWAQWRQIKSKQEEYDRPFQI